MGGQEVVGIWKRLLAERTGGNRKNETRRFGLISWEEITSAIEQEWRRPWVQLRQSRVMQPEPRRFGLLVTEAG